MHLFAKKSIFASPNSFASSSMMEVSAHHVREFPDITQAYGTACCGKITPILELNPLVFVVCSLIVLFYSVCYDNLACKVTKKT